MVFKFYPLQAHVHGESAARAAVAAMKQGKFWEMHHTLFEHQDALEPRDIEKYAKEIGLDFAKWKADWESEATADRVSRDRKQGDRLAVNGTPTHLHQRPRVRSLQVRHERRSRGLDQPRDRRHDHRRTPRTAAPAARGVAGAAGERSDMKSLAEGCGCFPTGRHYAGIAHLIRIQAIGVVEGFDADGAWIEFPIALIDVETTGMDGAVDRVVEIGIVVGRAGEIGRSDNRG